MPSHAEIYDASATEPSHWGEGMHKQEEVVKKKSFNCGLEKKNTSQEISAGQLNVCVYGSWEDVAKSSLGPACPGVS